MKKKFKILGVALAVCSAFAMAAMASGCSAKGKTDKFFKQLFCEHKYDAGVETQAATCTEEGVLTYTCTECGKTKKEDIPTVEHIEVEMPPVSPTCTEVGYAGGVWCEVCEYVIIAPTELVALGHFEVLDAAVAATCTTSGKTEGKHCTRCSEVLVAQEKIPAMGHKIVVVEGKAATCGETGLTNGQACEICGTVYVEQEEIPATGEHTDDDKNAFCDGCDMSMYDTSNAVEIEVVESEEIAGNWYRIYKVDVVGDPKNYGIILSYNIAIYYNSSGNGFYISPSGNVEGWDDSYMIVTDDYLDVYIPLGLTVAFTDDTAADFIVTETTTLNLGSSANVKRLVFSAETEPSEMEASETENANISTLSLRNFDIVDDEWTRNF